MKEALTRAAYDCVLIGGGLRILLMSCKPIMLETLQFEASTCQTNTRLSGRNPADKVVLVAALHNVSRIWRQISLLPFYLG